MGWGDVAKEALLAAKDSFERAVRLEVTINSVKEAVSKFEARIESSIHRQNESVRGELREFDSRLREIERHLSKTEAKVDGALAEAFRIAITQSRGEKISDVRELGKAGGADSSNGG
jgi:hypothetical protein